MHLLKSSDSSVYAAHWTMWMTCEHSRLLPESGLWDPLHPCHGCIPLLHSAFGTEFSYFREELSPSEYHHLHRQCSINKISLHTHCNIVYYLLPSHCRLLILRIIHFNKRCVLVREQATHRWVPDAIGLINLQKPFKPALKSPNLDCQESEFELVLEKIVDVLLF